MSDEIVPSARHAARESWAQYFMKLATTVAAGPLVNGQRSALFWSRTIALSRPATTAASRVTRTAMRPVI